MVSLKSTCGVFIQALIVQINIEPALVGAVAGTVGLVGDVAGMVAKVGGRAMVAVVVRVAAKVAAMGRVVLGVATVVEPATPQRRRNRPRFARNGSRPSQRWAHTHR